MRRLAIVGFGSIADVAAHAELVHFVPGTDVEVDDPGELPRPRAIGEVAQVGAFAAITYEALSTASTAMAARAPRRGKRIVISAPLSTTFGSGLPVQSGRSGHAARRAADTGVKHAVALAFRSAWSDYGLRKLGISPQGVCPYALKDPGIVTPPVTKGLFPTASLHF